MLLYIGCDAVPGVTWLAIDKIQTIEPFAMCSLCPERNHALAKTKFVCDLTYTHTCSNSL